MKETHAHDRLAYRILFPVIRLWGRCILLIFGPLKTSGLERIPKSGGALIICNHLSNLDPVVVQASCNRPVCFLSKRELFANPVAKNIIQWFGAFPIDRDNPDRKAIQHAAELIKQGRLVVIFPEGRLSETGKLLPIQTGFALIARISKCPIITCRLKNTDKVMPYAQVIPRLSFRRLEVHWGQLIPSTMAQKTDELLALVEKELSPDQ